MQRAFGFPRLLPINYTISVSYRCNSRCKTCQIYKKRSPELSLKKYEQFFRQLGKAPYWITFSGGEPFLRRDIIKLVESCYDISRPKIINIPTNGLLSKKIVSNVLEICKHCPKSTININLSIDEIGSANDQIRGVPGAYSKAIRTYQGLCKIKKRVKNLNLGIHTVISGFNSQNFAYISQTLMDMKPDAYLTEIAENRVELGTMNENIAPAPWNYAAAVDLLIHRIKNDHYTGLNKITQFFRLHYYQMVKKMLLCQHKIYDCYAGIASMQLSPAGDVWFCCMKAKSLGNINKKKFKKIWFSQKAKKARQEIKKSGCYCPLANAAYTNMLMNYKLMGKAFLHLLKK